MGMKIIVDIDVWNCQIRAAKPRIQTRMPTDAIGKMLFWNSAPLERLNDRKWGKLKGKALRQAERIVNREGAINISGIYGSILIDVKDFVEWQEK